MKLLKEHLKYLIIKKLEESYTTPVNHHEHVYEMDYIHKDGRPSARRTPKTFTPEEHKKHTDALVDAARKQGFKAHVHTYNGARSVVRGQVRHATIHISHKDPNKANDFINDHQHNGEVDMDTIDRDHLIKK